MKNAIISKLQVPSVNKTYRYLTAFVAASLIASSSSAQQWESYLTRPDILSIPAEKMVAADSNWAQIKAAHFSFVAFLLEAYPADTKIYFLARDSEHLYDVARLVTQGTPESKRLHLLNVSSINKDDPNLSEYLKQNGISAEALRSGQKFLFVDTGFSGTIPFTIDQSFPEDVRGKIKTHLLVSQTAKHPSSRTFLSHLNPMVNDTNPAHMHSTIASYENMPRYTHRSSEYAFSGGVWHPVSPVGHRLNDDTVDKNQSIEFMKDFVHSWNNPTTRARFKFEREQAKWIKSALANGSEQAMAEMRERLLSNNKSEALHFESQIRDFIDMEKNLGSKFKVGLPELGLRVKTWQSGVSKKNELINKFPEWKVVLEDPANGIPKLFEAGNWQMIANLIDAQVDSQIDRLILKSLFDGPATGIKKKLQLSFLETTPIENLEYTAQSYLKQRAFIESVDFRQYLEPVVKRGDANVMSTLADYIFPHSQTQGMEDLITRAIEKSNPDALSSFAQATLNQKHTVNMVNARAAFLAKAGQLESRIYARYSLPLPLTAGTQESVITLINAGDGVVMKIISENILAKSDSKDLIPIANLIVQHSKTSDDADAAKKYLDKFTATKSDNAKMCAKILL